MLNQTANGTERAAAWTAYNDQWYKAEGSAWYRQELSPSAAPAPSAVRDNAIKAAAEAALIKHTP